MVIDPDTGTSAPGPLRRPTAAAQRRGSDRRDRAQAGGAGFEGYWENDEAEKTRLRNGWYWTGDLGVPRRRGFFYFAGRSDDWLRVDGENFAAAPVERILERIPDVVLAAVYAVPDP